MQTFAKKQGATEQATSIESTISDRTHLGQSRQVDSILNLQRTIGNQAVQRMMGNAALAHDFSQQPADPRVQASAQPKLRVSPPGDTYEEEANRLSKQVMRMPEPQLRRICSCGGECPECRAKHLETEHERLQTKRVQATETEQIAAPSIVQETLSSPGQELDSATRLFMEPRLGHDFGSVHVHADDQAAKSAQAVDALAYTVGRDVVFAAGRYAPGTAEGRRLLAHELTHVVQQRRGVRSEPTIQRMRKGTGELEKKTSDGTKVLEPPPREHERRIDAAIEHIRRVAEDPGTYSACHDLFRKHCRGCDEALATLAQVFRNAVLWYDKSGLELGEGAWAVGCDPHIAYTLAGYNLGTEALAAAIMHEMGHVCGITGDARHHLAERIRLGCLRGARTLLSVRVGNDPSAVVFGFRTTFKNWLGGQYALRGGLDLDLLGVGGADYPAQIGSTLLRLEARAPLWWGGERWGGNTFFTDLGAGVGRFRTREPAAGDPSLALHGGVIIGLGTRLEWYLPYGVLGRRYPIALTAAYQTMIPLSSGAEKFQSILIGFETWFGD